MEENKTIEAQLLEKLDKMQKEIWYNRLTMAILFLISLFYINLKTKNIGDALGTFIEMFMP